MRLISPAEAQAQHGVAAVQHEMDNGELRFRLRRADGAAYAVDARNAEG